MLIRNADLNGARVDLRLAGGRIAEIAPHIPGVPDIDAQGGAVLPGLHDHHIHLAALAASLGSVRCGPPEVTSEAELIAALRATNGPVRGVAYHDSVAGEIDRAWLDRVIPDRPARIQHRGGRLWVFNSGAMEVYGLSEPKDGRLFDGDATLRAGAVFPDLVPAVTALLRSGVTGVTEVTPSNDRFAFQAITQGAGPLRLSVMGRPELGGLSDPRVGARKLHYHDHDLPALDDLIAEVAAAHAQGRPVASHCVTRAELMLTLAAIEAAGVHPGDRIEHAAIVDAAAMDWIARLGVCVVTQPNFLAERKTAYRADVPADDRPHLWRARGFLDAGVPLAFGTDAPFGRYDPWAAMNAAVHRPDGFGETGVSPEDALAAFTKPTNHAAGPARQLAVGEGADLIILDRNWASARASLKDVSVIRTIIDGVDQTPV